MEGLLPDLQERAWYPVGDMLMLAQRRYDPTESRLHVEYTLIRGGETEKRSMSARIYSYRELVRLLEDGRLQRACKVTVRWHGNRSGWARAGALMVATKR